MDEVLQEFASESLELASEVERDLLILEDAPDDLSLVNSIFRAFHTIKGSAGFMGVQTLVAACHITENLFDALRNGRLAVSKEAIDASLEASQFVTSQLQALCDGQPADALPRLHGALEARLQALIEQGQAGAVASGVAAGQSNSEAQTLGGLTEDDLWSTETAAPLNWTRPPVVAGTGALVEASDAIDWHGYYCALLPEGIPHPERPGAAAPEPLADQPVIAQASPSADHSKDESLRVKASKLDEMLEIAGESVQAASQASALFEKLQSFQLHPETHSLMAALSETLGRASRFTAELQRATLSTRMQPVGRLFQRFPRLVRDLSAELNKQVELVITGAETEVDRVVVDSLYDPMVHMMRNALDHGIESAEARALSGKPAVATVTLRAWQEGGSVMIEVADDGAGIDAARVRQKAIDKGLIKDHELMGHEESLQLVFLPGLSTKDQASAVSGRGVGMDVVKTMVEKHRGTIRIQSSLGRGTCFSIRLPIEMSIVPTMLIRAGGLLMGLPMSAVERVLELPETLKAVGGAPVYQDQGRPLPVRSLAQSLGYPSQTERLGVVIAADSPHIMTVNAVEGTADLVIKPLTALTTRGLAGTARSPEGEIVLVLALDFLLQGGSRSPILSAA